MAEVTNKVTDAQTAKKEAETDAAEIKKDADPKQTYERFRAEVDAFESQVTDVNLRKEYRKELRAKLGEDTLTTIEISYMNDDRNKDIKDKNGNITERTLSRKRSNDEASEVDVIVLGNINNKFEIYAGSDTDDMQGDTAITAKDLEKAQANQATERETAASREKNKAAGYADVLLDPNRSAMFQEMAAANNWFSSAGKEISKEDMREFLEEQVPAYEGADKNYRYPPETLKKLREIYDNWDSPQMKAMQNEDGELTVDSVAKGCGYESQAKYLEEFAKRKSPEANTPVERDNVVNETVGVDYKDSHRDFRINKEGQLVNYTETKDGKSTVYLVDAEGNVTDTTTGNKVKTKANFDKASGKFTYADTEGDKAEDKVDKKEERDTKVAEKVTGKFANGTREFRLNAKGEILGYTETAEGKEPQEFTVNEKNELLDKSGKVIGKSPTLNKDSKEFSYQTGEGNEAKTVKDTATELNAAKPEEAPKRDTVVAEKITAKFANGTREIRVNAKGEVLSYTQTPTGGETQEFTVNEKNEILNKSGAVVGKNAAFNKDTKEFTLQVVDGGKETTVKDPAKEVTSEKVDPASTKKPNEFLESAKQHSGQGYWQVGDEMLKHMAPSADPTASNAEHIIMMRALQKQQKQKHIGGETFVQNKEDIERLKQNIDAYVQGQDGKKYAKYAEALKARITAVSLQ